MQIGRMLPKEGGNGGVAGLHIHGESEVEIKGECTILLFECVIFPMCLQFLKQHFSYFIFSLCSEYLVELREYGPIYFSWSEVEEQLNKPLDGASNCIGSCCVALEELSEGMFEDILPVLREYVLYIESMKVRDSFLLIIINPYH